MMFNALSFRITFLIGFVFLNLAVTKDLKEDKSRSPEEEGDDLTREEQNYYNHYNDNLPGAPQLDYPIFTSIPRTGFSCEGKVNWHYYADIETDCQVFHVCESQHSKISFLCPEGSIFNQRHLVCDWWYNVDCTDSIDLFFLKNDFYSPDLQLQNIGEDFDLNLASSGGNEAPNKVDTEKRLSENKRKIQSKSKLKKTVNS